MRTFARLVIAGLFLTTGTLHFLKPELFLKIVPPQLPWPLGLVYLSGFLDQPLYHWIRIPFQGVLIAWVLGCAKR